MAFVPSVRCLSFSIASAVGTITRSILRRLASACTSFITGNAPVPVPTTRRRHFHGIASSSDNGVCPKASRNLFEAWQDAHADLLGFALLGAGENAGFVHDPSATASAVA